MPSRQEHGIRANAGKCIGKGTTTCIEEVMPKLITCSSGTNELRLLASKSKRDGTVILELEASA